MQSDRLSILFAGGGTGGHLFPAIAIADEIRKMIPAASIAFVGTKGKIEARVVPAQGYSFYPVWISGFRRKLTVENIMFPLKVVVALVQSFFLIKKLKPNVVVGTGGYVSGPVLYVASLLGVPTLVQEQNSYPGVTTRILSSRVDEVHISFERSRTHLKPSDNVKLTGNPTRDMVGKISREEGATYFGLDPAKKTVLVFGGSLGASSINTAMLVTSSDLASSDVQIIWQVGGADLAGVKTQIEQGHQQERIKVYDFIEKMEYAYAAADLAVCRSGATTVAELARAGVPSVLIPYPFAAADHQTENARAMVDSGASMMIRDTELKNNLLATIKTLLHDGTRLKKMSESARGLSKPNAASAIARAAMTLAKNYYDRTREGLQI